MKVNCKQVNGYRVSVRLPENIQEQAKSFLNIFNVVNISEGLYKVYKPSTRFACVICSEEAKVECVTLMAGFGEVCACEPTTVLICQAKDCNGDCEFVLDTQ